MKTAGITGNADCPTVIAGVWRGEYQLFLFTPEVILNQSRWRQLFRNEEYTRRLKAFVVDEAHTVKMW